MRTSREYDQTEIGTLLNRLRRMRLTYQLVWLILVVLGCAAIGFSATEYIYPRASGWATACVAIAAMIWAGSRVELRPSLQRIALIADRQLGLKERLSSAIEVEPEAPGLLSRALADDAARAAAGADLSVLHPALRKDLKRPAMLAALGLVLVPLSLVYRPADGAGQPIVSGVVEAVADLADQSLALSPDADQAPPVSGPEPMAIEAGKGPDVVSVGDAVASSFTEAGSDGEQAEGATVEEGGLPLKEGGASGPRKENPYATGHGTQANTATDGELSATPPGQDHGRVPADPDGRLLFGPDHLHPV